MTRLLSFIGLGSLIYAVTIVWGGTWLFLRLLSQPWSIAVEAYPALTLQTAIAFLPFGIFLAGVGFRLKGEITQIIRQRIAQAVLTGLAFSLALWGFYYGTGGEGGANIGLGFLMLISPFLISGAMQFVFNRDTNRNV